MSIIIPQEMLLIIPSVPSLPYGLPEDKPYMTGILIAQHEDIQPGGPELGFEVAFYSDAETLQYVTEGEQQFYLLNGYEVVAHRNLSESYRSA